MNSIEAATRLAHTTAYTLEWINHMWLAHIAHDSIGWTVAGTSAATLTLLGINGVGQQSLTLLSATSVFLNVFHIFIIEVVDCRQHGVWRCLAQTAEGCILDCGSKRFEVLNVIHSSLTLGNAGQYLKHAFVTDAARSALTARLTNGELKIELSNRYHAVVLVHYNHTTRTHH